MTSVEIERKYLVLSDDWRSYQFEDVTYTRRGRRYKQGYLVSDAGRTVRMRVAGDQAFITVKGPTRGVTRAEYKYSIPVSDAEDMLLLCQQPLVEKVRYEVDFGEHTWEIDEFAGLSAGLVVAKIELSNEDQAIEMPPWAGAEVSDDPRYGNSSLVTHPYSLWSKVA